MSEATAVEDFQQRVLAELAAVRADNSAMRADNERLSAEVHELRAASSHAAPDIMPPADDGGGVNGGGISRGQFLRLGAAAAAAGAVGAGASLLGAGPAGAATGTMQYGWYNDAFGSPTTLTSELGAITFTVYNNGAGGATFSSGHAYGLYGRSVNTDGFGKAGVLGRLGTTGADPTSYSSSGVIGTAVDNRTGVTGACHGISGAGVYGESDAGRGVVGLSETGIDLDAYGGGRIRQAPRPAGAPTAGTFFAGEQIRDANGELWLCVAGGSPGTWRRAATVREGFDGGSVNLLAKPIRIYDSRVTGGILANGATRNVQVTGVVVGGVSVPAGAKGVLGNITVVSTGASGYLTLFPQASPPSPITASINWFAANQVLNTAALVRLNPANGQMGVGNGLGGGSTSTHFVFDASGFVF